MTSRRLPETDIANICTLSEASQFVRLRSKRSFVPPHSLEATRRNMSSLFGVKIPIDIDEPQSDEKILFEFSNSIKRPRDRAPNVNRAEALLGFRRSCITEAVVEPLRSHRVSLDNSINLTHSLAVRIDKKGVIPFVDLRKSGHLSERGRDFVFAMNFHMIVDAIEDFSDFGLAILNYWEESKNNKGISPYLFSGTPRYTYEQLTDMIARTYQIWLEVLDERKKAWDEDENLGPLFGQQN